MLVRAIQLLEATALRPSQFTRRIGRGIEFVLVAPRYWCAAAEYAKHNNRPARLILGE